MTTQRRVTVGMPVYNDPEGLRRSVPSVLGQTWPGEMRMLIVDDGSTDETSEVLDALVEVYDRIEIVRHETNLGRPFARNEIISQAGDDYLAWCDAGDLWHPRKLELQLARLVEAEQNVSDATPILCTCPLRWQFFDRKNEAIKTPEIDGDQLFNALVGTLYPYLPTLLGRAEHFRRIGGFDERLRRRQDYDFLVRFLAEGGQVVSTPMDLPLFTYLKSDVGGSAQVVAAANRVIRQKHRQYYRRFGWRLAWHIRSKQHELVARFYRHNGFRFRSAMRRMRATVWRPSLLVSRVFGAARRFPSMARRRARHTLLRLLRPAVPLLRRIGTIRLVRRLGLLRLLARAGIARAFYEEASARADDGDPLIWGAVSGVERLKPQGDAAPTPTGLPTTAEQPTTWLQLEHSFRERGLLHSAEAALRQGIEHHPYDIELQLRLIELLPSRRKWAECVERWTGLDDTVRGRARAITYSRVARSFRELCSYQDALRVAAAGARLWPEDPRLTEELYTSRAALVDWGNALVVMDREESRDEHLNSGLVTDLGFLSGGSGPIKGWIRPAARTSANVSLLVNGTPVATTSAIPNADDVSIFALSCHDLRLYLGDGDEVEIHSEGQRVAFQGYGAKLAVVTGYESRFVELARRLDAGHVFTKFGILRRGNTRARRAHVLALYEEVASTIRDEFGYEAYPFYGNLLGAVREHDLITHDVGGFDMGYVSRLVAPDDVRAEFKEICLGLARRGFFVQLQPWSAYIRRTYNGRVLVDLNYGWFNSSGELNLSWGWRYAPVTDRERFLYPRQSAIGGHIVRVPGNAEQVLEQIYGPSWAIPDQGFELAVDLRRDWSYLLSPDEMKAVEAFDPDRVEARLDQLEEP
jgi:glycosyltransferase involved in cell wall biosynthesis